MMVYGIVLPNITSIITSIIQIATPLLQQTPGSSHWWPQKLMKLGHFGFIMIHPMWMTWSWSCMKNHPFYPLVN